MSDKERLWIQVANKIDGDKEFCSQLTKDVMEIFEKYLKYQEKPTYGTVFTLEEFERECLSGGFIDYDGFGEYLKFIRTVKYISPSDFSNEKVDRSFSHILWYNR